MVSVKRASLQRALARPARPVQSVPPQSAAPPPTPVPNDHVSNNILELPQLINLDKKKPHFEFESYYKTETQIHVHIFINILVNITTLQPIQKFIDGQKL